MINRIYNIIIYSHFALRVIEEHLTQNQIDGNPSISDYNILPSSIKEYLNEKSNKYLGLELNEIDHNKLFVIMHGTLLVDELGTLLEQFESKIHKIHNYQNVTLEVTTDFPVQSWVVSPFGVSGADFITTGEIKTYLDYIPKSELTKVTRDLQIRNILTS